MPFVLNQRKSKLSSLFNIHNAEKKKKGFSEDQSRLQAPPKSEKKTGKAKFQASVTSLAIKSRFQAAAEDLTRHKIFSDL